MLRVKSVVMLKANPGILKCGGVIKMWMWPCVERERELFRIWRQSWNEGDRKKYYKAKKDAKREVYMAMDQKDQKAVEMVDSCHDGCELFRFAKLKIGQKKYIIGVSCLKDEGGAVKVSVGDQQKSWKEQQKS